MTTSSTYAFNPQIHELIEEAYEEAGLEIKGGYELRTARRSLNLLMLEWANEGVHLWTMDQSTISLTSGTASYTMDAQIMDVIEAIRRNSSSIDTPMERITMSEYLNYPDKSVSGPPTHYTVERNANGGHTLYLYPTPDASYTFVYWSMRYIQDVGSYDKTMDVPRAFLPSLTAGLAYRLSLKNPAKNATGPDGRIIQVDGVSAELRQELKANYLELFQKAKEENRERASMFLVPG